MTQLERNSWHVKDTAVASELIELLGLSDAEKASLKALHGKAQELGPQMTQEFYDRILSKENTAQYMEGADVERLRVSVSDWFSDLFAGDYGTDYAQKRIVIGKIHVKIGLPVRYPLAMLDVVQKYGELVTEGQSEDVKQAFRKVLALDIAIFNQAYEDNQLHHLSELMGNERLARRLLQGDL
ncbi:protoglobin domain-containing protein [Deinococcus radiophilus]|uniref:Globin-coupled histidine kinase n=2 Tax=Deinococcus radiophilus TaxID=32062 RepID=A0A3S0IQ39_9DEIO|nr:protoglobin domain-containing protein [Deinococcus radiophilus]RTR28961.1 Globin-coupled histidine kinase [Deinococcus radiophilus]UFA49544.1 protoglobin domain-containing protein [Deinococcus radiophilus]